MTYLNEKKAFISHLSEIGCNLLRDNSDIDFALIDKSKEEEVYNYMLENKFICTERNSSKMNFKKFINANVIDIDIEFNTRYLNVYFYDIYIKQEFEKSYFLTPEKYQLMMRALRNFMLLRGKTKKYRDFFDLNKEILVHNNYYLAYLTKNPFKKNVDFDTFMKIIKIDKVALLKNIKVKYIVYFFWIKIWHILFKKRGKIVSIEGVDGAGKSTIIEILSTQLQKPCFYMGERDFRFDGFYNSQKNIFLKPIAYVMRNGEKLYRYLKIYKVSKSHSVVFTDRYHRYSKTAHSYRFLQQLDKIFFYFYPRSDIGFVLWNSSEVILSRKQEVSKSYIEAFNQNKEKDFPDAHFIKNDDIDVTLNAILKDIYA